MYLLKSKLSGLFISDDKGHMTSYPGKALSFIDEAAGKLYMAKHGFSQQYYSLFPEVPVKDMKDEAFNVKNSSNLSESPEKHLNLSELLKLKNKEDPIIEKPEDYDDKFDELKIKLKSLGKSVERKPENDLINHPNHYTAYSREVIDTMQGDMTPEEFTGYLKGNIIKYISRYQGKNGVQDLEKAQWYLNKLHDTVKDMKDEVK